MLGLHPFPRRSKLLLATAAALLVTSCGGGGGSGSSAGGGGNTATAPSFTSGSTASVQENEAGVFYTATATDPQGDAISYSIQGGADAGSFVLDGSGGLRFNTPPNFDLPSDANRDNTYEVNLQASAGSDTVTIAVNVQVQNDKEGISVVRIATGFTEPVAMAPFFDGLKFIVAERSGKVFEMDGSDGAISEISFIEANKRPGEILAAYFLSTTSVYTQGILLLTHSPSEGLLLQGLNPENGRTFSRQLALPWQEPAKGSLFPGNNGTSNGRVFAAIGDPSGALSQNNSSGYGKLWEVNGGDPFAGASLPSGLVYDTEIIGDGIRNPGGGGIFFSQTLLADQGATAKHEITLFRRDWRPLDFGWPFYEGSIALAADPPDLINGPSLEYDVGSGQKEGEGIIAGVGYAGSIPGIQGHYVFGDSSGKIFSIPSDVLNNGFRQGPSNIELRTEDFVPDNGAIDSPIAFGLVLQTLFILDSDGELFRVDPA